MAAQAHTGAGVATGADGVALAQRGVKAEAGSAQGPSAQEVDEAKEDANNDGKDDDDDVDGAVWETASLFEEILDDVAAFEYSSNSTPLDTCPPSRILT